MSIFEPYLESFNDKRIECPILSFNTLREEIVTKQYSTEPFELKNSCFDTLIDIMKNVTVNEETVQLNLSPISLPVPTLDYVANFWKKQSDTLKALSLIKENINNFIMEESRSWQNHPEMIKLRQIDPFSRYIYLIPTCWFPTMLGLYIEIKIDSQLIYVLLDPKLPAPLFYSENILIKLIRRVKSEGCIKINGVRADCTSIDPPYYYLNEYWIYTHPRVISRPVYTDL